MPQIWSENDPRQQFARRWTSDLLDHHDPSATGPSVLRMLLDWLRTETQAASAATVSQQGRRWVASAWAGPAESLPEDLLATVSESNQPAWAEGWLALPIDVSAAVADGSPMSLSFPRLLLLRHANRSQVQHAPATKHQRAAAEAAVAVLAETGYLLWQIRQLAGSNARLHAMLEMTARWLREDDWEALLGLIADAATKLLGAERASIFLWDRRRKKLIGKPALGVAQGSLEVDDSAGVVGAVLQSGQPRRWQSREDPEAEINRAVDLQLDYQTRSLVAVPLHDQSGKPAGVFEVINKIDGPFTQVDIDTLTLLAYQAAAVIRSNQLRQTAIASRDRLVADVAGTAQVVGQCAAIVALRETVQRVAATDLALLVLGENGTGKEVLARSVHFQSGRRSEPFVAVNCAALVETLLESELFGHEKGAFTDAHQTRAGKFELASGGTLFLDEIGDMSLSGQAKLLRVLEEKIIVRVGGSAPIPVDVRVIAATNQPLAEMVREKRFREDLYFRLNVVSLQIPPLRERGDDLLLLANHFLQEFAQAIGRQPPILSRGAVTAMRRHPWAGNIRELRNLMERVSYLCTGDTVQPEDLAFSADPRGCDTRADAIDNVLQVGLQEATRRFQMAAIQHAIQHSQGNMTDAAAVLGLHRSNFYRKLKQLGIGENDQDADA